MLVEAPNLETAAGNVRAYTAELKPDSPALLAFTDELILRETEKAGFIQGRKEVLRRIARRSQDADYAKQRETVLTLWITYECADSNTGPEFFRSLYNKAIDAIYGDNEVLSDSLKRLAKVEKEISCNFRRMSNGHTG